MASTGAMPGPKVWFTNPGRFFSGLGVALALIPFPSKWVLCGNCPVSRLSRNLSLSPFKSGIAPDKFLAPATRRRRSQGLPGVDCENQTDPENSSLGQSPCGTIHEAGNHREYGRFSTPVHEHTARSERISRTPRPSLRRRRLRRATPSA